MQDDGMISERRLRPWYTSPIAKVWILFAMVILAEFTAILMVNHGRFLYSLDDAYIHLALADNIAHGHYGINATEFSAPSSSILWPFLLVPFSLLGVAEYVPLLINIVCAIATLLMFRKIVDSSIHVESPRSRELITAAFLVLFILCTNMIGLIFIGMEHSLQVLSVVLIAWGLMCEARESKLHRWLLVAIVVAPMIRYESLAVTTGALMYLALRGHFRTSAVAFILVMLTLGSFSLFLMHLGLGALPTSVMLKSPFMSSLGSQNPFRTNLEFNLRNDKGLLLFLGCMVLALYGLLSGRDEKKRLLALVTSLAILLHLVAGRFGWYYRYEVYVMGFSLCVMAYVFGETLLGWWSAKQKSGYARIAIVILVLVVSDLRYSYVEVLFTTPDASNNIYEQQYQMHRFAKTYYGKPVAVNDVGCVSYGNENYVLDLWGLASSEALTHRRKDPDTGWMNTLAASKGVQVAMIYELWFRRLPTNWKKIGELHLRSTRTSVGYSPVSFFALNENTYSELLEPLRAFRSSLPEGVIFEYSQQNLK